MTTTLEQLADQLGETYGVNDAVIKELEGIVRKMAMRIKVEARVPIPAFADGRHRKLFLCIYNNSLDCRGRMWGLWVGPYRSEHKRVDPWTKKQVYTYRYSKLRWYNTEQQHKILAALPALIIEWKKEIDRDLAQTRETNKKAARWTVTLKELETSLTLG